MTGSSYLKVIKETPDFEDEKTIKLFDRIGNVKKQGYLTKPQALDILKWKSPRPLRHYEINSENDFKEITGLAFESRDERLKIHILTALTGVNYPAASAILMFYDRTMYPIIDIRVWKQFYKIGLVDTNAKGQGFTLKQWIIYLELIRGIAKAIGLTPRQVEKRLFDISKKEQTGTLYKVYKPKRATN